MWPYLLPLAFLCAAKKARPPTLAPGDGRKRDWAAIAGHLEMEWLNESPDCDRGASRDGDVVAFKHKGFIAELPSGKTTDGKGRPLQVGLQMDSNIDPETKEDKPLEFTLGSPRLIVGMEAVLRQMCEGEKVRAKIPGALAYNTRAGFLPYDTAVLYEMEMVSITRGDGTIPVETVEKPTSAPAAGESNWSLALVLILLLGMVAGGFFYLRAPKTEKVKGKDAKKDGKKKRGEPQTEIVLISLVHSRKLEFGNVWNPLIACDVQKVIICLSCFFYGFPS